MEKINNCSNNMQNTKEMQNQIKTQGTKNLIETQKSKENYEKRQAENQCLTIIPKTERYIQYMLDVIFKLPRTEKFSIGTEYKNSLYEMITNIVFLSKVSMEERFDYTVKIDVIIQVQRIYLRLMKHNKWIDDKKFKVAIEMLGEIGKINGGLVKYYGKNYKKSV